VLFRSLFSFIFVYFLPLFFLLFSKMGGVLEFVDVLVSVHRRAIFVLLLAGDQDDQENDQAEQTEQAEDGDTHSNQTGLVGGEFTIFGSAPVDADDDAVRIGEQGSGSRQSVLEDNEIFVALGEVELAALPDEDGAVLGDDQFGHDGLEVLNVGLAIEPGDGPADALLGRLDGTRQLRGYDGNLERVRHIMMARGARTSRTSRTSRSLNVSEKSFRSRRSTGRSTGRSTAGRRRRRSEEEIGSQLSSIRLMAEIDKRGRAVKNDGANIGGRLGRRPSRPSRSNGLDGGEGEREDEEEEKGE